MKLDGKTLVLRYAAFAACAIATNLLFQNAVLLTLDGWYVIYLAIAAGNASGLLLKFVLDKKWIFYDPETRVSANAGKFFIYSALGVLTTGVFWATELTFHYLFKTVFMTNVGAVLGLVAGYLLKYHLDKNFTFRKSE